MKIIIRLFFCLLLCQATNLCAQANFNLNQGGTDAKNYLTAIPYQMVNGKIFIDVEIGGKKHKFLLDTGAPTAISTALVHEIKAVELGKAAMEDISNKSDSLKFVTIKELKLGDLTFSGIPALGSIPHFLPDCLQADGIIGSNLLRNSVVGIQSSQHMLVITDQPEKLMIDRKYALPMLVDSLQSTPFPVISLNGLTGNICFDTGMNVFINGRQEWIDFFKKSNMTFEEADNGFGSNVFGLFGYQLNEEKHRLKLPAVSIGGAQFRNVYFETTKDGKPVMGTRILDHGSIILDYVHKQFYFFPNKADAFDMEEKHWPVGLAVKDGKAVIAVVWSKGKDLLKLGEQVLAVDGKEYGNLGICDLANGNVTLPNDAAVVTLTIKDARGKKRTVKVDKQ